MNNKKYLNVFQKVAYGADGFGNNFFYTFISTYMLLYLTDVMGMNAGIIGTLILISKLFDGLTDVFFGSVIDRTNSKWGKARPWLLGSAIPLAIIQVMLFAVPKSSAIIQYAYFFVVYCAANAIFYTANNVSFSTLTALITHNATERVQLGAISNVAGSIAGVVIPYACSKLVFIFGNGVSGWRTTAFIFAFVQLLFCAITFWGTKEIPLENELTDIPKDEKKISFINVLKVVVTNKYYLIMLMIQILLASIGTCFFTSGAYYCQWILGNGAMLAGFSTAFSLGMFVGMVMHPFITAKLGYRKTMGWTNVISVIFLVLFVFGAYIRSMPIMLVSLFIKNMFGFSSIGCCMFAAIADIAKFSYRTSGIHVEGAMFSCTSMGMKIGQGITASICGWLLTLSGYIGTAASQSAGDALWMTH